MADGLRRRIACGGTPRRWGAALLVAALIALLCVGALACRSGLDDAVGARVVTRPEVDAESTTTTAEPPTTTGSPSTTTEAPVTTLLPPDFVPVTAPAPPRPPTLPPPPPPPPPPVVSVYGDSLVWEARNALGQLLRASGPARIESFGGTALCDFSQEIVDNARSEPTRLVVIAFTGNTFTPCMKREGPSPSVAQWTAMYVADVNEVIGRLHELEVPVLLVGAPPSIDAADVTFWTPINAAWAGVAAQWRAVGADVSYADTGRVLADADGQWTATLPCLPTEGPERGCVEGLIPVRSPDRGHFCPQLGTPVNGAIQECAVWSGGAWRYALSIAGAVEQRL